MVLVFLFFLVGGAFTFYKMSNTSVVPIAKHQSMQSELDQIIPPEGDRLEGRRSSYQTYRASGSRDYRSTQSKAEVASYYRETLRGLDWKDNDIKDGEVVFCKEERALYLSFVDVRATRYSIGYLLDGDRTGGDTAKQCP